jgi:hypothetical protein
MRKIFLPLLICVVLFGCSSNDENTSIILPQTTVPEELIGSWKFIGIYNYYDIDQLDNPYIHLYENGEVITFSSNSTFNQNGEINYNGTFTISEDSVLKRFYNATNETNSFNYEVKIVTLNDSILDYTCTNENNIGTCPCEAYRFVKL